LIEGWAVSRDRGANRSVYFLLLVFVSVVGYAVLYTSIHAGHPTAFDTGSDDTSIIGWIYFSATTVSTVGYGDIHPHTAIAAFSVTCQIASGPLLLAWLISVLVPSAEDSESIR
jgi:hypothetical protein